MSLSVSIHFPFINLFSFPFFFSHASLNLVSVSSLFPSRPSSSPSPRRVFQSRSALHPVLMHSLLLSQLFRSPFVPFCLFGPALVLFSSFAHLCSVSYQAASSRPSHLPHSFYPFSSCVVPSPCFPVRIYRSHKLLSTPLVLKGSNTYMRTSYKLSSVTHLLTALINAHTHLSLA